MIDEFNEAPVATLQGNLDYFSKKLNVEIIRGTEEYFDDFQVVELKLSDGFIFSLHRYSGEPKNTINIYFRSKLPNWQEILQNIFDYLQVQQEDILEINNNYMNFH